MYVLQHFKRDQFAMISFPICWKPPVLICRLLPDSDIGAIDLADLIEQCDDGWARSLRLEAACEYGFACSLNLADAWEGGF